MTPLRTGSSPAIWSNWRRDGATSATTPSGGLDWANAGKSRETSYQRKESGIKVLKPKTASRTISSTAASTASTNSGADGKSRFFDDGRRIDSNIDAKKENPNPASSSNAGNVPGAPKAKSNPIGGGSAFSWLNPAGSSK
jgi:hypothetical protein